jgi:hypothetical protein
MTSPSVPPKVINTVLNMYRENVTQDLLIIMNKSWKLFMVGCWTNSLGGNRNISFSGLKALLIAYKSGYTKNNPKIVRMMLIKISPPRDRFGLL